MQSHAYRERISKTMMRDRKEKNDFHKKSVLQNFKNLMFESDKLGLEKKIITHVNTYFRYIHMFCYVCVYNKIKYCKITKLFLFYPSQKF